MISPFLYQTHCSGCDDAWQRAGQQQSTSTGWICCPCLFSYICGHVPSWYSWTHIVVQHSFFAATIFLCSSFLIQFFFLPQSRLRHHIMVLWVCTWWPITQLLFLSSIMIKSWSQPIIWFNKLTCFTFQAKLQSFSLSKIAYVDFLNCCLIINIKCTSSNTYTNLPFNLTYLLWRQLLDADILKNKGNDG